MTSQAGGLLLIALDSAASGFSLVSDKAEVYIPRQKRCCCVVLYILPTYRQVPHPFRDRWPFACLLRTIGFAPSIGVLSSGMLL